MDIALNNEGDFALNASGVPYLLSGMAQLMQRVKIALKIKKGSFTLDNTLGSELYLIDKKTEILDKRAEMLVREAIANVPSVEIRNVTTEFTQDDKLKIKLVILFGNEIGSLEVIV